MSGSEHYNAAKRAYLKKRAHILLDEAFHEAEQDGWYGDIGVISRIDGGEPIRVRQVREKEEKYTPAVNA